MIKGVAFDVYATVFDVFSVAQNAKERTPANDKALANFGEKSN